MEFIKNNILYSKLKKNKNIILYILIIVIFFLSISNSSIWVDEGIRLNDAKQATMKDTLVRGFQERQILEILILKFWNSIVGDNAFLMRCLNIFFGLIAVLYLKKILDSKNLSAKYILLLVIQPFFIYYMNDIGPYIMLLSAAMAFIYYTFFDKEFGTNKNLMKINLVFALGISIHFIFVFIYAMYITKIMLSKNKNISRHLKIFFCFLPFYLLLGIAYMQYMESGSARGWSAPGIKNIGYVLYGILGYQGIGLSRNDLRAGNFYKIGILSIVGCIVLTLAYLIVFSRKKEMKMLINKNKILLISTILYSIVFYIFSFIYKFQFWERHWIALFVVYVILLIDIFSMIKIKNEKNKISYTYITTIIMLILLVISSLNIRFNYYYAKDDFKGVINYLEQHTDDADMILLQGETKTFGFYNVEENENVKFINEVKEEEDLERYLEEYSNKKIYVILCEKQCEKDFYRNIKNVIAEYNTFKVIEK